MKTHSLVAPRKIDPVWLRQVQGSRHISRARRGGVMLGGVHLRFLAPEEDWPAEGTAMVVWLERNFTCATKDENDVEFRMVERAYELAARD